MCKLCLNMIYSYQFKEYYRKSNQNRMLKCESESTVREHIVSNEFRFRNEMDELHANRNSAEDKQVPWMAQTSITSCNLYRINFRRFGFCARKEFVKCL